jgi:hypothetical protein
MLVVAPPGLFPLPAIATAAKWSKTDHDDKRRKTEVPHVHPVPVAFKKTVRLWCR